MASIYKQCVSPIVILTVIVSATHASADREENTASPVVVRSFEENFPESSRIPESAEGLDVRLTHLVDSLGDSDYSRREAAAKELGRIGPAAVDALLTAADTHRDIEIKLRAQWLVDAMPLSLQTDSQETVALLEGYKRKNLPERLKVMHHLLRLEDDKGVEPLARIVRLERSPVGSRVAAAILVREWRANDVYWEAIREPILAGIGSSDRPSAKFLRTLVLFSPKDSASLTDLEAAIKHLHSSDEDASIGLSTDDETGSLELTTSRIFSRCYCELLLAANRHADAILAATTILDECILRWKEAADDNSRESAMGSLVSMLAWTIEQNILEASDHVERLIGDTTSDAHLHYAFARAAMQRGDKTKAEQIARTVLANNQDQPVEHLQSAILLARWGCVEWARNEYTAVISNAATPAPQFVLASIFFSEFLHDRQSDGDAARALKLLADRRGNPNAGDTEPLLQRLGRDPRSVKSRMLFFEACAAASRGDFAAQRKLIEDSIRHYPKDVDSLIALYHLPDQTMEQKQEAIKKVTEALAQIEAEIQAVPDDANGYNEYAWLVANTEGDIDRATRYSKKSLAQSFDSSSYLDTLAHCRATAGDLKAAIKYQSLAQRQEPHNATIGRNLERFRSAMNARAPAPVEPVIVP